MKVLLISHTCQSLTEGQPKAAAIAARLDGELLVLAPDRWKHYGNWRTPQVQPFAPYHFISGRTALPWTGPGQFYLHFYPALASILSRFRPDIIDVWEEPWSLVSAQACWLRNRLLPKSRIISETEQNLDRHYPPPFKWFRSRTLANADFAIGRSTEAVRVIQAQGYTGPAETVPNAVDSDLFFPMDRNDCRRKFQLSGFVIGYIGRIVKRKGLMDLVNALPLCPGGTQLVFAGPGEVWPELQAQIHRLKLEPSIRFLPECPPEQLPALMNALDVLALPSRTTPTWKEQFGRVIIEAHACGTPVIGSTSGAIPEVIGAGGVTFHEGNPEDFATKVSQLVNCPNRLLDMGLEGRKQVLDHYTWGRVADQMLCIYEKVRRRM